MKKNIKRAVEKDADKKILRGYFLLVLICVIYGAAILPFPKNPVFWTAFTYSLAAVLAQIYTLRTILKKQALIKDRIYDFPLLRISILYLVLQLAASLLLMGFSEKIPVFGAVILETVIVAVAVAGFYAVEAARAEVTRQDGRLQEELTKMREIQTRVNILITRCREKQIREILQKLAEEIRYSSPVSRAVSEEIEEEIEVLLTEMEAAVLDGDVENAVEWCSQITGLLKERDRLCKYGR